MSKMGKLAALKIIFTRGRDYAAIVQFLLLIFLTVRELQRTNVGEWIPRTAIATPIFLLLAVGLVFLVGYVDYKFLYGKEQERTAWKNPVTQQMLKDLAEIKQELAKRRGKV